MARWQRRLAALSACLMPPPCALTDPRALAATSGSLSVSALQSEPRATACSWSLLGSALQSEASPWRHALLIAAAL
jgi:hypothetical protein